MNMLLSILVIAGMLFGGGVAVNAAQDDLPNEPLYSLKTWSEDVSLKFEDDPEVRIDRLMQLAQLRVQEMIRLVDVGEPVPDQVRLRLEQHLQQAIQTCLTVDEPTLDRTLLQIRDRLRDQDRDMDRLQLHTQDQLPLLTQTRTMLRERLRLVEEGLLNHEMFRERVRSGFHFGQEEEMTPPVQNGSGQQNSQPTRIPGGPATESGGPNTDPGGPNTDSGGPNTNPGGPATDPGGPNTDPGGPNPDSGGPNPDPGGPNSGGGNNGSGSTDTGGNGSGGGSGGNKP